MPSFSRRQFLTAAAAGSAVAALPHTGSAADPAKPSPRKTRFAVNIEMWWRNVKPFEDRLDRAADMGFPAVEFWPYEGKNIDAIAKKCEKLKIEVAQFTAWGFKPGMNDPANHDKVVAKITEACDIAKRLNCKMMTVVGGDDQPGMTQKQMHDHIITALKRVAPIAEKNQVMLILEPMNIRVNHKGHCLYGSEPTVNICRAVKSPFVKINWDLYHMQISEGDLCGRLKDGLDQLGYVQIADHPGRNEPGTGEIHYPRVLRQLSELGYKGYVGLELTPKKDEATAAQAVWAADQW
jgi:hydroxypyruvate isomerase